MDFSGLPLGALDQVALACHDLLHADEWMRVHFGGDVNGSGSSQLTGTASIPAEDAPGGPSTTLTGTGTLWASTERLGQGEKLLLGDQVATIAGDPSSDTSLEIEVAHADGLVDQPVYKCGRGYRTAATVVAGVALPYWVVFAGQPSYEPGISRLLSDPSVTFAAFYDRDPTPEALGDQEGTWAALVQYVTLLLGKSATSPKLQVSRFGSTPLVDGFDGAAPGQQLFLTEGNQVVESPALSLTFRGRSPALLSAITQRW